jgi:hypothetical protein
MELCTLIDVKLDDSYGSEPAPDCSELLSRELLHNLLILGRNYKGECYFKIVGCETNNESK